MKQLQINYLQSGGLIANYYCSSACVHCLYRCGPTWPKEYIDPETARRNFETIRRLGCRSVHIGGGEPLLRHDALEQILEAASDSGISIDYVETNSAD
jgi:molybdenum cofactor biosynthesis enzyme MoaA